MGENNKDQKLKKCLVCTLLEDDEDLSLKVNSLLKTTENITPKIEPLIADLISSKNIKTPSSHLLNKHKNDCLKDFIPEIKVENLKSSELFDDILNVDLDEYDSWDSIKKETEHSRLLNRIYYKKLLSIDKLASVQKISDISVNSLKTLKDLINDINIEHIKLDITDRGSIEKTGVDIIEIILARQNINLDIGLDIAKLLLTKGGKLEFLKYISDISDEEELDEVEKFIRVKRSSISKENEK